MHEQSEYKDNIIKWQKQTQKILLEKNASLTGMAKMAKPYLDVLIYYDSDEDWALLKAFFCQDEGKQVGTRVGKMEKSEESTV